MSNIQYKTFARPTAVSVVLDGLIYFDIYESHFSKYFASIGVSFYPPNRFGDYK